MTVGVRPMDIWVADEDLKAAVHSHEQKVRGARGWALVTLAYQTCGIVYGDLATSVLYTLAAVFAPVGAPTVDCTPADSAESGAEGVCQPLLASDEMRALGTLSMVFWALTLVVLLKYVGLVLRADDNGEGGTFALYSLLCRAANVGAHASDFGLGLGLAGCAPQCGSKIRAGCCSGRLAARVRGWLATHRGLQLWLLVSVMVSACMVMSDGVLTPAISVISAVEGLRYNAGISRGAVLFITCTILIGLFLLQSKGTARVSFLFSPVILIWLVSIGGIGLYNILAYRPDVVRGISPHYIYYYWKGQPYWAWQRLGKVMLAITGAEALYADMGHFSRLAIQLSFVLVVYPCLVLTYLGQAAYILEHPEAASAAFWASQPPLLKWPMVVLATCAAVIASQSLITGTFSIVQQASALSCFPRVAIKHTSRDVKGQVYIPAVNFLLAAACTAMVLTFRSSAAMGSAYGLAVSMVEVATTSLLALLMLIGWHWPPLAVGAFWVAATSIEGAFLSSNLAKIPSGAWFSLLLSLVLAGISYTWHWGQNLKLRHIQRHSVPLQTLLRLEGVEQGPLGDSPPHGSPSGGVQKHRTQSRHAAHAVHAVQGTAGGSGSSSSLAGGAAGVAPTSHEGLPGKAGGDVARDGKAGLFRGPTLRLGGGGGVGAGPVVARLPGVGIFFHELLTDAPPMLVHFLRCMPALHEVVILLTVRHVPLPHVPHRERLLLRKLCLPGFFHAVVRYGYMDEVVLDRPFVQGILQAILCSDGDYTAPLSSTLAPALNRAHLLLHRAPKPGSNSAGQTQGQLQLSLLEAGLQSPSHLKQPHSPTGSDASRCEGEALLSGTAGAAGAGREGAGGHLGPPNLGRGSGFKAGAAEGSSNGGWGASTGAGGGPGGGPGGGSGWQLAGGQGPPWQEPPWLQGAECRDSSRQGMAWYIQLADGDLAFPLSPTKATLSSTPPAGIAAGGNGGCWLAPPAPEGGGACAGSGGGSRDRDTADWEKDCLERAYWEGPVTYLVGKSNLRAAPGSSGLKVLALEGLYAALSHSAHSAPATFNIPHDALVELGVTYQV